MSIWVGRNKAFSYINNQSYSLFSLAKALPVTGAVLHCLIIYVRYYSSPSEASGDGNKTKSK